MISVKKLIYKIIDRIHYVPLYGSITGMIVNDKSVSGNGAWTNCGSITLPAGVWILIVSVSFPANATGYRAISISNASAAAGTQIQTSRVSAASGTTTTVNVCAAFKGGTWYINASQNSGSTLTASPRYTAVKIGEDTTSVS